MGRFLRDKDGKFAGSTGSGARPPEQGVSADVRSVRTVPSPDRSGPSSDEVSAMYDQYRRTMDEALYGSGSRRRSLFSRKTRNTDVPMPDQLRDASGASFNNWQLYEYGVPLVGGGNLVAVSKDSDADLLIVHRTASEDGVGGVQETFEYVTFGQAVARLSETAEHDREQREQRDAIRAAKHERELTAAREFIAKHGLPIRAEQLAAPGLRLGPGADAPRVFIIEREDGRMDCVFKQYYGGVGHSTVVGNGMTEDEFVSKVRPGAVAG